MKESTTTMLIFGVILVAAFYFLGNGTFSPATTPSSENSCTLDNAPQITVNVVDKYAVATAENVNVAYRKVGETTWSTTTAGSTLELAPGDKIEFLADPSFSVGYGEDQIYTVPCKVKDSVTLQVAPKISASITGTFWNADGDTAAQDMGVGDAKTVSFRLTGEHNTDYGNAQIGYNVLNCKVNSTEITDFQINGLQETAKPSIIPATTGMTDYTYKFPVMESNKDYKYDVYIVASDSVNPTHDIVCTLYDTNYDINQKDGSLIQGVQDESRNNLGLDESTIAATVTIDLS